VTQPTPPSDRMQPERAQAQTVSSAVARKEEERTPAALIKKYTPHFKDVLPADLSPDTFVRLANGVMTKNPDVREAAMANPWSLVHTLLECARLGHEPGSDRYAIVKFNDKNAPGGVAVVGIEQYQGELDRMFNAGGVQTVICDIVYDFEMPGKAREGLTPFRYQRNMDMPIHEPDFLHEHYDDQTHAVMVYAYARLLTGGTSHVIVMPRSHVMRHREVARSTKFWDGPFWGSMWRKTAVHELAKWVPTSAAYRETRARIDAAAADVSTRLAQESPVNAIPAEPADEVAR
jgi:recombination protein RecT